MGHGQGVAAGGHRKGARQMFWEPETCWGGARSLGRAGEPSDRIPSVAP